MARQYASLQVIPGEEASVKNLVEIFVANITGTQANHLVRHLSVVAPLGHLGHLKRIRKRLAGPAPQLQIVLCSAASGEPAIPPVQPSIAQQSSSTALSQQQDGQQEQQQILTKLPEAVFSIVQQHDLQVQIVKVPKSAPASREQWKDWNQMWPISWRKPELTAVTAATAAAEAVTVEEEQQMHAWMDRAYDLAEANKSSGQICNAAVIVDPATGLVIAEGQDGTHQHPLSHAILVAVEAAAARDRRLWPTSSSQSQDCGTASARDAPPLSPQGTAINALDEFSTESPAKRRCTSAAGSFSVASEGVPATQEISNTTITDTTCSADADHETSSSAPITQKSYLCTGFDCYVVQEPCAMCAMAATHARLRRICYSVVDDEQGMLGGALKLHGQTSLNHHYQVFHLPVAQ